MIQSVSGSDIVVAPADGTTWTWDLVSNTVVREQRRRRPPASALSVGEQVFVGGPVVSGDQGRPADRDQAAAVPHPAAPQLSSAASSAGIQRRQPSGS